MNKSIKSNDVTTDEESDIKLNVTNDENTKESENDSDFGIDTNVEEHKIDINIIDIDLSAFVKKDENGKIINHPPSNIFIDDGVFSHLPISDHRECLSILKTLAKLKLYAWQNSEGIRKIIKKYDKNFDRCLTTTLWPKIRVNEFMQAKKNDSYIAQVSAVLCTRIIPFGYFSVHELEEKGLNLKQMANSIKQLEKITSANLKEIIPMNVEPRSYMANERTFLKWMRMAAMSALVGMILMAMHYEPVTGVILVLLSMAIIVRSYHEYYMRNEVLVNRIEYNWIDTLGPKLLMLALLLPMITYLVYLAIYGSSVNVFHK